MHRRRRNILIDKKMGTGASLQAKSALNYEASKPLDASDVADFGSAKIELINARRQAQFYRNQALPKYQVDMTGDGRPNAIGYDTNGNGHIDSLDTTMDGLIDTVVVVYGQQSYFVPVGNLGNAVPFTRANNGQYVVTEEPKSDYGCYIAAGAGAALAVATLSAVSQSETVNNAGNSLVAGAVAGGQYAGVVGATVVGGVGNVVQSDVVQGAGTEVMNGVQVVGSTVVGGVGNVVQSDVVQGAGTEVMNGVQVVGSTIGEGIEQGMNSDAIQNVGNGIQTVGADVMNGAQVVVGQAVNSENMTAVGNTLESGANTLSSGAGAVVDKVLDGGTELMEAVGGAVGSVVSSVGDVVGGAGKDVVGAVGSVLDAVGSAVKSVME